MMNPIEQFEIHELFPIVKIGNFEIAFTNSAAYMLAAVALITIFLLGATGKRSLVPSRFQSAAEMSYGQNDSEHRWSGGNEIFPVRIHTIHVHIDAEHDQPNPTHFQRHEPDNYHCCTRAHSILYSSDVRLHQAWVPFFQCVRA
jgi:hypothetical protein